MGVGRSGGVVSSAVGGMLGAHGSVRAAFVLYGLSFVLGGALTAGYQLETARRSLTDAV